MFRFDRVKILELFLSKCLGVAVLARRAGVGYVSAMRAVNGEPVGAKIIAKVAAALEVNPVDFLAEPNAQA